MTQQFYLSQRVKIASLPTANTNLYGITPQTAGWGLNASLVNPWKLQKMSVKIMPANYFHSHWRDSWPGRNDIFYFHKNNNFGYGTAQVTSRFYEFY